MKDEEYKEIKDKFEKVSLEVRKIQAKVSL